MWRVRFEAKESAQEQHILSEVASWRQHRTVDSSQPSCCSPMHPPAERERLMSVTLTIQFASTSRLGLFCRGRAGGAGAVEVRNLCA